MWIINEHTRATTSLIPRLPYPMGERWSRQLLKIFGPSITCTMFIVKQPFLSSSFLSKKTFDAWTDNLKQLFQTIFHPQAMMVWGCWLLETATNDCFSWNTLQKLYKNLKMNEKQKTIICCWVSNMGKPAITPHKAIVGTIISCYRWSKTRYSFHFFLTPLSSLTRSNISVHIQRERRV